MLGRKVPGLETDCKGETCLEVGERGGRESWACLELSTEASENLGLNTYKANYSTPYLIGYT